MPRGNPKKPTALRLDPELVAEVRAYTDNLSAAIEEALRLWLRRAKADARRRDGLTRS
jgi:post-segregation antitoxin (ccd killing protein)